ncbi:MAG: maltose ABC transporter permease MalF [Firmicutes bacterium]|nr:maltose ABC transporter permease MalF [Bacillota bacterium]
MAYELRLDPKKAGRGKFVGLSLVVKVLLLGLLNAMAFWAGVVLFTQKHYWLVAFLLFGAVAIDYIYLTERTYPLRFILPGTLFLLVMVVYPMVYTIYISFTNYGTGHLLSKEMVIAQYTNRDMLRKDLPTYQVEVFKNTADEFAFLLTEKTGVQLVAVDGKTFSLTTAPLTPIDADGDGEYERLGDYERQSLLSIFPYLSQLQNLTYEHQGLRLKMRSPNEFAYFTRRYQYDPGRDVLTDLETQTDYVAVDGNFVAHNGESLDVGYKTVVGWRNFRNLFTDRRYFDPFLRVFLWTVAFAFLSVVETFLLGLFLAVLLNDNDLKFRGLYRALLIIPYAMPAFVTCLIWRGFFSTELGIINSALLVPLFGKAIPWFQDPFWAKVAVLIVNLWLGYPYMMLICSGALQSIPRELYEAAMVDGAGGWKRFRTITFPLLLTQVVPLLISSFAFNFNNLNVIYLVTRGRPPIPGSLTPTGATDILISYTYRMAFETGSGGNYGLAAAVSLLIFLLVCLITVFNIKSSRLFREVPQYD